MRYFLLTIKIFILQSLIVSSITLYAATVNFRAGQPNTVNLKPSDIWVPSGSAQPNGPKTIQNFAGVLGLSATASSYSSQSDFYVDDFAFGTTSNVFRLSAARRAGQDVVTNVKFVFSHQISGSFKKILYFGDSSIPGTPHPEGLKITFKGSGNLSIDNNSKGTRIDQSSTTVSVEYNSNNATVDYDLDLNYGNVGEIEFQYTCFNNVIFSCASLLENWIIEEVLLDSSNPANGAVNVPVDSNIVLNFNQVVDVESGNIVIKKKSDNSIVETIDVSSGQVTGSGTSTITVNLANDLLPSTEYYVQIDSTALDNPQGQSYAGLSSTTALSFTTAAADTTSPTMAITAAEVSTGATSSDTTLTLTFTASEPTTDFAVGDITVNNGTLSNFVSVNATIYTATLTPTTAGPVTVDVAANTFTDAANNQNLAAMQFVWNYELASLPSPLEKEDVIGSIEAWSNSTNRTAQMALNLVEKRLDWLKRRLDGGAGKTSSQGIDIRFADQRLQRLFFEPANTQKLEPEQIMLKAANMAAAPQAAQGTLVAAAESEVLNQFAVARTDALGATSPTFESDSTISDWSWWTMGTIMVGKQGERSGSSGLKVHADYLTFGVDRPTDRFGVVGASIMFGQDETDVGSVGSKVSNNSYSIALYNAYPLSPTFTVRSIAGGTDFDFKTRRVDGDETLLGKRGAQQLFASVELRQDGFQLDLKNPVDLEWYVKADWVDTKLKQFAEEGGTFALLFETQKLKSQHLRLGLDAKTKLQGEHGPIVPYMGLEYASNLSPASNVDMRYVSETRMYRYVLHKAYDSQWTLGLGVDYYIGKLRLGLSYERKHQRNYGYLDVINLGLEGRF